MTATSSRPRRRSAWKCLAVIAAGYGLLLAGMSLSAAASVGDRTCTGIDWTCDLSPRETGLMSMIVLSPVFAVALLTSTWVLWYSVTRLESTSVWLIGTIAALVGAVAGIALFWVLVLAGG